MDEKIKKQENDNGKNPHHDILKWVIVSLLIFAVIILVFSFGIFVGSERARFSYRWAENYTHNFGGPRMGFENNWQKNPADDFIQGHGIFGQIVKIENNIITIKDNTNLEKAVLIKQDTVIISQRNTILIKDLKVNDNVVIIGSPNESGKIEAKIIRVMPSANGQQDKQASSI